MRSVYAIVLNWNGWRDTARCLASLHASTYPDLHIVVVDNGSTDGSVAQLAPLLAQPRDELVCAGYNRGFTGGTNLGMRRAIERGADYIFLLNNDATVAPECIAALVAAAERRPDVGFAGPTIMWAAEPRRLWSAGMSVAWSRAAIASHAGEPDDGRFDGRRLVQGLSGCALLVKRPVLEQVGLLDERYFAYYEDMDWCLRARRVGFRCLYVGDACVVHAGSASSNRGAGRSQGALRNYYAARNILLFFATHAPPRVRRLALALLAGRLVGDLVRVIAGGLVLGRRDATRRARALLMGAYDAMRGRFGARWDVPRAVETVGRTGGASV